MIKIKGKKAGIPYWIVITIYSLLGLLVILGIIALAKGKMSGFITWLKDII